MICKQTFETATKNGLGGVLKRLGKRLLMALGLSAAASPTDAAIHQKIFGSGFTM